MAYFDEDSDDEVLELDETEMDLQMLRDDLVGELQAINQYQDHIDSLANEEATKVLEHIRDDEKEHVAEIMKLLQKLDSTQAEKFKKEKL
ncbi:MAG: demethoxyubiquinone hydroxylase family protein [Chloroflexi bacterium]|nr:demethoxyubiquinone hydroxylase family protein [Chloroflexota bacterium]